jgi:hypothetical protein
MRIGVRRLRSCVALADGMAPTKSLDDLRAQTRWVLDALGPARDLDVFADQTLPAVLADLNAWARGAGLGRPARRGANGGGAAPTTRRSRAYRRCGSLLRARSGRRRRRAAHRDQRRGARPRTQVRRAHHRQARAPTRQGGREPRAREIEARHATRIAAKKLRYATEFFATLFRAGAPGLSRRAREAAGRARAFNDAAVASRVAGVLAGPTAPATVAIEAWSAARTEHCADAIDTGGRATRRRARSGHATDDARSVPRTGVAAGRHADDLAVVRDASGRALAPRDRPDDRRRPLGVRLVDAPSHEMRLSSCFSTGWKAAPRRPTRSR